MRKWNSDTEVCILFWVCELTQISLPPPFDKYIILRSRGIWRSDLIYVLLYLLDPIFSLYLENSVHIWYLIQKCHLLILSDILVEYLFERRL